MKTSLIGDDDDNPLMKWFIVDRSKVFAVEQSEVDRSISHYSHGKFDLSNPTDQLSGKQHFFFFFYKEEFNPNDEGREEISLS